MARSRIRNELVGVLWLLVVLLFAYKLIFIDLLFTPDGTMGHDYAYFLPVLLSGYFWYQTNGLAHIPWFHSFCSPSGSFCAFESLVALPCSTRAEFSLSSRSY